MVRPKLEKPFMLEVKSPFLRKNIEQRGIDDLVTDLLIAERYLLRPELTDSVAALMLRGGNQRPSLRGQNRES